jgi:hypothetical protein
MEEGLTSAEPRAVADTSGCQRSSQDVAEDTLYSRLAQTAECTGADAGASASGGSRRDKAEKRHGAVRGSDGKWRRFEVHEVDLNAGSAR